MSNLTKIYRTSDETGKIIRSHDRKVRLDEDGRPYVIMNGQMAYLKKVRGERAMIVTKMVVAACCEICGRILTNEESVERGIGPVCAHA